MVKKKQKTLLWIAAESTQFHAARLWWPHDFCVHVVPIIHVAQSHLRYRSMTLSINLKAFPLASFAVLIEQDLHNKPEVCLHFGVYKTINCTSLTHCAHFLALAVLGNYRWQCPEYSLTLVKSTQRRIYSSPTADFYIFGICLYTFNLLSSTRLPRWNKILHLVYLASK